MKFEQNWNLCFCAALKNVAHPGAMLVALVQAFQGGDKDFYCSPEYENSSSYIYCAKPRTQPTCPWYSAAEDLSVSGTSGITFYASGRIWMLTSR